MMERHGVLSRWIKKENMSTKKAYGDIVIQCVPMIWVGIRLYISKYSFQCFYLELKDIEKIYACFFIPNLDGVVPETNNATKLPSKGNEQLE